MVVVVRRVVMRMMMRRMVTRMMMRRVVVRLRRGRADREGQREGRRERQGDEFQGLSPDFCCIPEYRIRAQGKLDVQAYAKRSRGPHAPDIRPGDRP